MFCRKTSYSTLQIVVQTLFYLFLDDFWKDNPTPRPWVYWWDTNQGNRVFWLVNLNLSLVFNVLRIWRIWTQILLRGRYCASYDLPQFYKHYDFCDTISQFLKSYKLTKPLKYFSSWRYWMFLSFTNTVGITKLFCPKSYSKKTLKYLIEEITHPAS